MKDITLLEEIAEQDLAQASGGTVIGPNTNQIITTRQLISKNDPVLCGIW